MGRRKTYPVLHKKKTPPAHTDHQPSQYSKKNGGRFMLPTKLFTLFPSQFFRQTLTFHEVPVFLLFPKSTRSRRTSRHAPFWSKRRALSTVRPRDVVDLWSISYPWLNSFVTLFLYMIVLQQEIAEKWVALKHYRRCTLSLVH